MSAAAMDLPARARQAAATGDWTTVRYCLAHVDAAELGSADVELAADASWWLSLLDESLGLRQRAYAGFVELGESRRAAWCAWYLWFDYRFKGDTTIASAWLTRAERHVADEPDCVEAGYVALARAVMAREMGHHEEALALTAERIEIGRRLRSANLVALATVDHGRALITMGSVADGVALLDDAMCSVIAGELDPVFTGLVFCDVLAACFDIADLRRAGEWTAAAVAWCESLPTGSPYHGVCRIHRVEVTSLQGAWGEAEAEAIRASEELFVLAPGAAGSAHYAIGEIRRRRGDLAGAEAAFVRAHDLGHTPQPGLALLRLLQNRVDEAVPVLRLVADELPSGPLPRAFLLAAQVEIGLAAADLEAAASASEMLDELAASAGHAGVIDGLAALARARLALVASDLDGARDEAARASKIFRELRVPHEAAAARTVLGEALQQSGDSDGGWLELEAARRAFTRLGAVLDAERVGAMLSPTADSRPAGLTARELEVLRLVAAGKTNRAVAGDMYLSEHTVSRHLQNIFAKLGVSSRAAATAFAYEHELV